MIERFEGVFGRFSQFIQEKLGYSVFDVLQLIEALHIDFQKKLNNLPDLFDQNIWSEMVESLIDKGYSEPEQWLEQEGDRIHKAMDYITDFAQKMIFEIDSLENISSAKAKAILDFFSLEMSENCKLVFYTEKNPLLEKPIIKLDEKRYLVFNLKHVIDGFYNTLFEFFEKDNRRRNRILKSRDSYVEEKTEKLFLDLFLGKCKLFSNYYIIDGVEQDLIIFYKRKILIIEVKANKIKEPLRDFKKAYKRIESDFKRSVQAGFDQTVRIVDEIEPRKILKIKD